MAMTLSELSTSGIKIPIEDKKKKKNNSVQVSSFFDDNTALQTAKKKYNTLNDAINSLSTFSKNDISKALNEAKIQKNYYKNEVLSQATKKGIETNSKNKNLEKSLPNYRKDSITNLANNKYSQPKYQSNKITEMAKKSDAKYSQNKAKFDTEIKNSNDYENYDAYAYRALPLLQEVENQNKANSRKVNVLNRAVDPLVGGLSNGLNNTFLPTSDTYKLANGEIVRTKTQADLNAQNTMSKSNGFLGKLYNGVTYSLGNMIPSIVAGQINPILGATTMGVGVYNNAYENSLNEGYTPEQANKYALANTTLELGLEKALGGMSQIVGESGLSKVMSKTMGKVVSNPATRKYLAEMGSEFTEEYLQEIIDPVVRNITLDENNKFKPFSEEALISGLSGAINAGISNFHNYRVENNNPLNSNKISQTDKFNLITQSNQQTTTDNLINDIVNQRINQDNINRPKVNLPIDENIIEYNNLEKYNSNELENFKNGKVKEKNSATASDAIKPRSGTSETDSGTSSYINNNMQNTGNNILTSKDINKINMPISLDYQVETAIKNSQSKNKNYLGKVTKAVASKIKSLTGINVENRTHVLSDSDIRHMLNQHGNVERETAKGQIAITIDDIKNIPNIINNPDNVTKGSLNKAGASIRYIKALDNYTSYVVEVIPNKSKNLQIKTMWKTSSVPVHDTNVNSILRHTSITENSSNASTSINSNITQSSENVKLPINNNIQKFSDNTQRNINMPSASEEIKNTNKILNPNEISKLTQEDANTTPQLQEVNRNEVSDGNSRFYDNIKDKTNMLNEQQKHATLDNEEVKYYDKVTNKESLNKAFEKINKGGKSETLNWFNKDSKSATSTDVAEGWILLKQYADNNDYESMVEVAKKMRDIGTKAGQTVQAFNIMERMTPEGMVKYAQSELQEAWEKMIKNKSQDWIDKYRSDFDLKPDEVQFIMDNMKEVATMEDGYDKRVKLAEIQKLMTDKLPPVKGAGIKSWMRISMLFNPKTQVRNVVGNAAIMPINSFSDLFSSYADKLIAKKTGVRTTGKTNIKAILKGMKEGAYQATNDYKKGINTKDMEGNRFEITEGKNFNDKTLMGKSLNRVEGMLNYVMDAGDRVFSQAAFENSLQNQLVLNNTTEITQEMLDIARAESLQRTWNDNNNYTKLVLRLRKDLNQIHLPGVESYGLGDILIPFAKTPANLTKAIVDYSPVGLVSTIVEGNNLRKSLTNGQFTASMQHKFVQDLGKATAGTILYVLGYALAKSGVINGESDDDKDVSNFMKNTLGISSYSIKIGNKSFTYDWAQPIAAPLSIMANINQKQKENASLFENITSSLNTAGSILLEQSFFESIKTVISNNDGVVSGIQEAILELPSRAVPTFSKQIADMVDGTQRTSFEYDKPIKSAVNSIKAKIPFVSKTLSPTVDTLGREVQKYGGKNNIFNVFLNPANVNTENISDSAKEIYRLYKQTGATDVMPRVAPYYLNKNNEKIILNSEQRTEYQKESGKIIENGIKNLLKSNKYKEMDDTEKSQVIKDLVNYSYNIAQKEVLNTELSQTYQKAYEYSKIGNIEDYYLFKNSIDEKNKKESISNFLINSDLNDKELSYLYGNYYSSEEKLNDLISLKIPIKEYIKLDSANITSDYNTKTGKTISGSKKQSVMKYVNSLNLSVAQKAILIKMQYNSFDDYNNQIINYVNNLNLSSNDKKVLLKSTGFDNFDKDVVAYINSQSLTASEKEKKLKSLGFTIRNGKVYLS